MDALIELSDENADWKLSFDEFLNCLKPGFNPPEKSELKDTRLNNAPQSHTLLPRRLCGKLWKRAAGRLRHSGVLWSSLQFARSVSWGRFMWDKGHRKQRHAILSRPLWCTEL